MSDLVNREIKVSGAINNSAGGMHPDAQCTICHEALGKNHYICGNDYYDRPICLECIVEAANQMKKLAPKV